MTADNPLPPAVHNSFIAFADEGAERGACIGRYVFMPDHLHLFLAMDDEPMNPSGRIKSMKNVLSRSCG